jgi:hypothetical protein
VLNVSDQPTLSRAPRRPVPPPGSEAALAALRTSIAVLEDELHEIERRIAELDPDRASSPTPEGPLSARMADELGTSSVEQERADMRRFLDGALAVCEARVAEARSEARAMLDAARDDLARAVRERAAAVEEVIASTPPPLAVVDSDGSEGIGDASVLVAPAVEVVLPAGVTVAEPVDVDEDVLPVAAAPSSARRRATVISVLLWIVGGALVVVGLAFAIVVVLMLLD